MKLPKPRKRGDAYRIELMYEGQRYSCTRDTVRECEQWAAKKLLELKAGVEEREKRQSGLSFYDVFTLYYGDVGSKMKTAHGIEHQLSHLRQKLGEIADTPITDITPKMLSRWRDMRCKQVKEATVKREMNTFSSVFSYAQKHLFLIDANPFTNTKKPRDSKPRYRRIAPGEIIAICDALDYPTIKPPKSTRHYVAWAFLFAIETAMRRGEIMRIRRHNVYADYVHIPDSKNDEARNVPLSDTAKELIAALPWNDSRAVPRSSSYFEKCWQAAKESAELTDLRFHDTRHEGISRMVKVRKMPVEVLSKVTGHKDIETLIHVYYNPDADDLVEYFNREI